MRLLAPPAAAPKAGLPLRAWRAAGRILGRASLGLAAAGRAGWTGRARRCSPGSTPRRGRIPAACSRRCASPAGSRLGRARARFLAEAEALLTARARGCAAAAPLFAGSPPPARRRRPGTPAAAALLRPASPRPGPARHPAAPRPSFVPAAEAAGTVVMTAAFGRPPALPPVAGIAERVRFLCFTDRPDGGAVPGWTMLPPAAGSPDPAADPAAATRLPQDPRGRGARRGGAGGRAPRSGSTPTASSSATSTRCSRAGCCRRISRSGGTRTSTGGPWPSATSSRARAPAAAVLAQAEALRRRARARQPRRLRHRHGLAPARRPGRRGALRRLVGELAGGARAPTTSRSTARSPRTPRLPAGRRSCPPGSGRPPTTPSSPRAPRRRGRRAARGRRRPRRPLPVVFLSAARFANSASTFLRGRQLSALVAAACPDYDVRFTEDADSVRDAVVVLTKGAMETLDAEAIAELGRRNIAVIGCWDDIRPEPDKARAVDAHMTLSHRQTLDLDRLYPETPAFLVTHHVNRQVPAVTPPARPAAHRLLRRSRQHRAAGLGGGDGRPRRHRHPQRQRQLARRPAPTTTATGSCATPRRWDSWKPFLKGFVAARCGAPVIVVAEDDDAAHYLGDDYPFYARSLAAADLEMAMATAAAGFGGPDWARARDIMAQVAARSTDAQVCAEFRLMIEEVIA